MILVSAWDTRGAQSAPRAAPSRSSRPTGGTCSASVTRPGASERLRAGARDARRSTRISRSPTSRSAMVHVARGHLTEAERVLQHGTAVQDRQIARGERYPALGLHWLLGLVRLAQDDVGEALEEFDRERALAAAASSLRPRILDARAASRRGAAPAPRRPHAKRRRTACSRRCRSYPDLPLLHAGMALAAGTRADWTLTDSAAAVVDEDRGRATGRLRAGSSSRRAATPGARRRPCTPPSTRRLPASCGWWLPGRALLAASDRKGGTSGR